MRLPARLREITPGCPSWNPALSRDDPKLARSRSRRYRSKLVLKGDSSVLQFITFRRFFFFLFFLRNIASTHLSPRPRPSCDRDVEPYGGSGEDSFRSKRSKLEVIKTAGPRLIKSPTASDDNSAARPARIYLSPRRAEELRMHARDAEVSVGSCKMWDALRVTA